jgi:eukaryotic-like serine/threonine-protein kinase
MSENVSTWSRLEGLFAAALQLPAGERRDFVARECAGQGELREELQRLLDAEAEVGDFLAPPTLNFVGQRFGAYEALGELGRGGMSVVYKGRRWDGDFEKAVAIKILLLQPRQTLQTSETQILAGLEHPNIARLLDAGATVGGLRFLVMEFVDGVPCSEYAGRLTTEERLRLFVAICRAVQFAHQSLVVHRDLKPANILVTADGTPKLLDFGIAKLLTTDTQVTQTQGIRAYTPDYASPEQILGQAVTTASDVYSLGALLCELLSGKPPRQLNTLSAAELIAAVQKDAIPSLPFGGDLALIVQKALRRVPGERYQSASDLANDVERYLQREPIVARAPSWKYLAGKFVERNRLAVAATSLAVLALVATTGVAVWQAQRALAEKARAEEVKEFITQIFKGANQYASGARDVAATKLLAQADERIDRTLGARPDLRVELRTIIAESLSSMQDNVPAQRIAMKAAQEAAQYLGADHARTLQVEALALGMRRQSESNEVLDKEYKQLVPRMRANQNVEPLYLSHALESASAVSMALGKGAEAEGLAREALAIADQHLRESDQQVMHLLVHLSFVYQRNRKFAEALAISERVHRITFEVLKQDPKHPNALDVRMSYGMALCDVRQWDKGLATLREAVEDSEKTHGAKSRTVAFYHTHLARYLGQYGDLEGSARQYGRAVEEFVSDTTARQPYVLTTVNQASMLIAARRTEEALRLIDVIGKRSAEFQVAVPVPNRAVFALAQAYGGQMAAAREALAQLEAKAQAQAKVSPRPVLFNHGVVLRLAGDYQGALEKQRRALATPAMTERERAAIETEVGLNELALGNMDAAAQSLEKARKYFAEFVPLVIPAHADALVGLAEIALQRGNLAQALPLARKANEYWQKAGPNTRWAKAAAEALVGAEGGNKSKPGQSPNRV